MKKGGCHPRNHFFHPKTQTPEGAASGVAPASMPDKCGLVRWHYGLRLFARQLMGEGVRGDFVLLGQRRRVSQQEFFLAFAYKPTT